MIQWRNVHNVPVCTTAFLAYSRILDQRGRDASNGLVEQDGRERRDDVDHLWSNSAIRRLRKVKSLVGSCP